MKVMVAWEVLEPFCGDDLSTELYFMWVVVTLEFGRITASSWVLAIVMPLVLRARRHDQSIDCFRGRVTSALSDFGFGEPLIALGVRRVA